MAMNGRKHEHDWREAGLTIRQVGRRVEVWADWQCAKRGCGDTCTTAAEVTIRKPGKTANTATATIRSYRPNPKSRAARREQAADGLSGVDIAPDLEGGIALETEFHLGGYSLRI